MVLIKKAKEKYIFYYNAEKYTHLLSTILKVLTYNFQ